jgi:hypothetical protein
MRFFLPVWIHLGLNVNRFFFHCNNVPSLIDNYFKFWCISGQPFSEILRISEKDWQLSSQFSEEVYLCYKLIGDMLMLLKNILGESWTQLPICLWEPRTVSFSENRELSCQSVLEILWISEKDLHLSSISWRAVTKNTWKLENCGLSWQSFSEILRISEGLAWNASNLKYLSQIKGTSLKIKNQKRFLFSSSYIYSGQKTTLKS